MTDKKISIYISARYEEFLSDLEMRLGINTDAALIRFLINQEYQKYHPEAITNAKTSA